MRQWLRSLIGQERAQDLTEYALLLALLAIGTAMSLVSLGFSINLTYDEAGNRLLGYLSGSGSGGDGSQNGGDAGAGSPGSGGGAGNGAGGGSSDSSAGGGSGGSSGGGSGGNDDNEDGSIGGDRDKDQ